MTRVLQAVALALTMPVGLGAQAASDGAQACVASERALLEGMRITHDTQRNVGLGVAISRQGKVVFTGSLGFADLEHRVPVTTETRFGIASVTKAFTGVALLKAVAAGGIDLDAPIQRYVPEFPEKPGGTITARLLMAHLAGIRHWGNERTPVLYATHMTDVMQILPLFRDDPLVGPPGHQYRYSSLGYNLLAMAIQSAMRQPFQDYVRREILDPLDLVATDFDDVEAVIPHRARRYSYYHPVTYAHQPDKLFRVPAWDYSHNMGGGNMIATASDLARFGDALIRPGLLTGEAFELLHARNSTANATSGWSAGFLYRPAGEDRERLHITGSNAGLQAALYIYPGDELVVVVLSNTWGINSRSGEMVAELPERLAALCLTGQS